jgi:hypothetical protein
LGDGFPLLKTEYSILLRPYAPPQEEHDKCQREIRQFPTIRSNCYKNFLNRALLDGPTSIYLSEWDVRLIVREYLKSIITAVNLSGIMSVSGEVGFQRVRTLYAGSSSCRRYLEVKKPGTNILIQPTILGEIYDHILVAGYGYRGASPILGILTTGVE